MKTMKLALVRVRDLMLAPTRAWEAIADERGEPVALTKSYVAPLAAVPAICGLIGRVAVGESLMGVTDKPHTVAGVAAAFGEATLGFALAIGGVWLLALVINGLAPLFGGVRDFRRAFAVAAYAGTPAWVFGMFGLFPALGWLIMLLGALWSFVLLYLGLPRLMRPAPDKAVSYFATALLTVLALAVVSAVMTSTVRDHGGPLYVAQVDALGPAA
jgi:hypothetical protein